MVEKLFSKISEKKKKSLPSMRKRSIKKYLLIKDTKNKKWETINTTKAFETGYVNKKIVKR